MGTVIFLLSWQIEHALAFSWINNDDSFILSWPLAIIWKKNLAVIIFIIIYSWTADDSFSLWVDMDINEHLIRLVYITSPSLRPSRLLLCACGMCVCVRVPYNQYPQRETTNAMWWKEDSPSSSRLPITNHSQSQLYQSRTCPGYKFWKLSVADPPSSVVTSIYWNH